MLRFLAVVALALLLFGCRSTGHSLATAPGVDKGAADGTPMVIIIDDEVTGPVHQPPSKPPKKGDVSVAPPSAQQEMNYTTGKDAQGEYRDYRPVGIREYEFQQ